ncbi:MAG: hypothetical protein JWM59_4077 [Verrucomicrobiales bacterium]|nr:hypothetical protein [Verrucomicrobiales bacterium]
MNPHHPAVGSSPRTRQRLNNRPVSARMKTISAVPFLLVAALVVHVSGSFSGTALWNALPVGMGFGALQAGLSSRRAMAAGCIAFAVSITLLVALFHLAWLFDWGGTATGSSTSAVAFMFVPLWAVLFAGIIGLVAWGVGKAVWRG